MTDEGAGSSERWRPSIAHLLVLPAVLLIVALFAIPVLRTLWMSFTEPQLGFENYGYLLTSSSLHRIIRTTLAFCLVTTVLTVFLGYIVTYAMVHAGRQEVRWMFFFILLTFWLSSLIRTFAWLMLLRDNGPVNQAMLAMGLIDQPLPMVRNTFGVLLGMVHVMMPLAILPLYAALQGIDKRLVAAARGLGCGPVRAFLWVFLPLSLPGILAATVLVFILSLGFYITPAILGGGKVVMIAEFLRTQFESTLRWGYAAMLAAIILVSVLTALALAARFINLRKVLGGRT